MDSLLTGIWPFGTSALPAITGPKTDLWLVRPVALLIGAVSAVLLAAAWRNNISLEVLIFESAAHLPSERSISSMWRKRVI
jgi:hypothetical protein